MESTPTKLRLEQIVNYPIQEDKTNIFELLVLTDYMLSAPKRILSKKAIYKLLELHPIQVISGKRNRYECIGGLRSLSIAREVLLPSDEITVHVLTGIKKVDARQHCFIDVFLSSCLSLRKTESFYRIATAILGEIKDKVLPEDKSITTDDDNKDENKISRKKNAQVQQSEEQSKIKEEPPVNLAKALGVDPETIRLWNKKTT